MRLIDADMLGLTDMEIIMCDGDYKEALKMLIDKIEHATTIKPMRKRGVWLQDDRKWICSECGELVIDDDHNYCPNCGSDMRGDKDENQNH